MSEVNNTAVLTAPLAWMLNTKQRSFLRAFRNPGERDNQAKLVMLEPHEPGKIPVVFVHGLLSDPLTWVSLANELRAVPWFNDSFEIWAFRSEYRQRVPTSIDLLKPDSPLLAVMRRLPVGRAVKLHSIIGTGRTMLASGPADGVVPVASARHPGVASERFVSAVHGELHHHPDTVEEILSILTQHLGSA